MDYEQARQRAHYMLKMQLTPHRVGYIYTARDELQGQDPAAISRGMINVMADIAGVHIWVNFTESDAGVLCELRSDKFNINPVAVAFGGGGHQKAAAQRLPTVKRPCACWTRWTSWQRRIRHEHASINTYSG